MKAVCAVSGQQTVVQQNGVDELQRHWNSLIQNGHLSGFTRNGSDPPTEVIQEEAGWIVEHPESIYCLINLWAFYHTH